MGVFDGATLRPTTTAGHNVPSYPLGGLNPGMLYGADASGSFYTLQVTSAGVTIGGEVTGLLGGDGTRSI